MKQEYSFTLTIPATDTEQAEALLNQAQTIHRKMRVSRKPDRGEFARYYLSFPFSGSRPDLEFQSWFTEQQSSSWELFGPTYGRWGLC